MSNGVVVVATLLESIDGDAVVARVGVVVGESNGDGVGTLVGCSVVGEGC